MTAGQAVRWLLAFLGGVGNIDHQIACHRLDFFADLVDGEFLRQAEMDRGPNQGTPGHRGRRVLGLKLFHINARRRQHTAQLANNS